MDKRVGFWAIVTVVGFIVLTKTQLLNILIAFFILGAIPGTNLVIPAWIIFTVYPIITVAILLWLGTRSILLGIPTTPAVVTQPKTKRKKVSMTRKLKRSEKRQPRVAV